MVENTRTDQKKIKQYKIVSEWDEFIENELPLQYKRIERGHDGHGLQAFGR